MARSSLVVFFVVVALLFASVDGAIKKCRQDQKTLISNPELALLQEKYHSTFLQECLAKFEETKEFTDNTFECSTSEYAVSFIEAYRSGCASSGGLNNVVTNSHVNLLKKKTEVLLSVSWFQCVASSCSVETDLPYIAASQRRDTDFGAAIISGSDLVPTYVDGLKFFFSKQQPAEPAYGSSSSSSDPYGYYSASSSSNPYAGSSSSSSSDPYGYYSASSSSNPYAGSSSSSSDPYGYSSSSSSDPYGYSSSSSSSDPYGYSSSSSSSDPYGYSSSSSSSDPYGYSSSSSSSDPYGYSSSSSSSDPYGYYSSSSSSDSYGDSSSSSSDSNGYSASSSFSGGFSLSEEKHHKKNGEGHHKGAHKHDSQEPNASASAFSLLFSSMGVLFVFLLLVIFAVLGLALFRRRSASTDTFALVDAQRYPSKEV